MIHIQFLMPQEGRFLGFCIKGHAGWAEEGSDVVCAAVSSAAHMAVNTITVVLHVEPLLLTAEEGEMALRLKEEDEPLCRAVLAGLAVHLDGLELDYPAYMEVSYLPNLTEYLTES